MAVARRPPSSAVSLTALVLSSTLLPIASGHALPRETKTVPVRELNVVPWPIATPAPQLDLGAVPAADLLRRDFNTICGFIGGHADFPATCLAGSHCAVDVDNKAIGCCPDGAPCTGGIFTGCVDVNSPPQTELNPYVFTCTGADVCYQNHFDGGFFQFGCGASSALATSVATSAFSRGPLDFSHVSVRLTATPTLLATPTTIGSRTGTRSSDSTSTGSSKTKTTDASDTKTASTEESTGTATETSPTESSTSTSTAEPAAPTSKGSSNTGPIVGGVVGGLAGLALLLGLLFFFIRRKKAAKPAQYIEPSTEKYNNSEPQYPPKTPLLTEERGVHPEGAELSQLPRRPSEAAPQLGEIGLAVPFSPTSEYSRPSDEIPLRENTSTPKPDISPPIETGPYIPRRRADGDGTSFWSQTRSESRSRGRPWV
ncbi:hypothetical protein BBK36DRAFT_1117911 [Trichoderma citrinoviride]|uniref:Mid2 domain-containing protein n=1 Tax=Trichoderma citrinoviride TaxID=58853 RepID=A0A2T4BBQ4_9HYPO|nr:hypothetical protein BBK36DRAFT_1117911 [Trichoderma citrinoviride]PTB66745.1 hypothetical protein BBK36DRAFT_1117911 [Trichoderma citrinoviride]